MGPMLLQASSLPLPCCSTPPPPWPIDCYSTPPFPLCTPCLLQCQLVSALDLASEGNGSVELLLKLGGSLGVQADLCGG